MFVVGTIFTVWGILASISQEMNEKKTPRKKTHIKILQYFADSMLILNRGIGCRY